MKLVTTKCPNCNASIELNEKLEKGICQYCGETVYIKEALEKKKVELSGNVNVTVDNNSKKIKNIKNYLKLEDYENAKKIVNEVLADDPFNMEVLEFQVEIEYIELKNNYSIEDDEEFDPIEYEEASLKELKRDLLKILSLIEKIITIDDDNELSDSMSKYSTDINDKIKKIEKELKKHEVIEETINKEDSNSVKPFLVIVAFLIISLLSSRFENSKKNVSENNNTNNSQVVGDIVKVYVFYGDGCSHCEALHEFLNALKQDGKYNSKFEVVDYEVWYNEENENLMKRIASKFDYEIGGVPFYVIGDKYFNGYSSEYEQDIKTTINSAFENNTYDIMLEINK